MMKAIQKSSENTNTKTKTMTKTTTKTKTHTKCLKNPIYAIFLKSWWLTHSKYDDRYLTNTMVILFTPVTLVTLVTLFRSYNQFYRAECITVSGFFLWNPYVITQLRGCDTFQIVISHPGLCFMSFQEKFNYPVPSHFQFSGWDGSGTWKKVRDGSGTGIPSDPAHGGGPFRC